MKTRSCTPCFPRSHRLGCTLFLLVLWAGQEAQAQPAAAGAGAIQPGSNTPFRFGRIVARPRVTYGYSYNEGVLLAPGQPENTEQWSFSPGIAVALGDRWNLDYSAVSNHNSNSAFRDAWAHSLRFEGTVQGRDWAARFAQNYSSSVSTLIETGKETAQQTASSMVGIARPISSELSFQTSFEGSFRFVETLSDSYGLVTTQALAYRYSPKVDIGLALMSGYSVAYKGADSVSISPQLQLSWKPGDKLGVSLSGGYERRILVSKAGGESNSPVFSSTVSYKLFEFTTLSIAGTRSMSTSVFADQVSKSRSWTASLEQRLLKHFTVSVSAVRSSGDYVSVSPDDETVNRHDSLNSFDLRLSTTLLKRGSVSIAYGEVRNTSSETGFTTSSRQIGVQAGFSY
jgi:hypothetical protein